MAASPMAPLVTLQNGNRYPAIGLGTFTGGECDCKGIVKEAILKYGYRSVDTATLYANEGAIGEALLECFEAGVPREELFIATKLWHDDKDDVEGALRRSLQQLHLDYIDLYLIHWMVPKLDWNQTDFIQATPTHKVWAEMERLVDAGLIRNIGVSNCPIPMLMDLWSYARHKPVINQIEVHPYMAQTDVLAFHHKLGIKVQAYAPLGSNGAPIPRSADHKTLNILGEPVVQALAEKFKRSPAQVVLNWHLHRGTLIIPKTVRPGRLEENYRVFDFKMDDEEYESITALDCQARFFDAKVADHLNMNHLPYFE